MTTDTIARAAQQLKAQAADARIPGPNEGTLRPVVLQRKRGNGLWTDVAEFDAGDAKREPLLFDAAPVLCRLDPALQLRVMPKDFGFVDPLLSYSAATGWVVH